MEYIDQLVLIANPQWDGEWQITVSVITLHWPLTIDHYNAYVHMEIGF